MPNKLFTVIIFLQTLTPSLTHTERDIVVADSLFRESLSSK
jgi:hypothetical protein